MSLPPMTGALMSRLMSSPGTEGAASSGSAGTATPEATEPTSGRRPPTTGSSGTSTGRALELRGALAARAAKLAMMAAEVRIVIKIIESKGGTWVGNVKNERLLCEEA
jgi:hypothetical protein